MRSSQLAVRIALVAGLVLLTLASTGEWVPIQVLLVSLKTFSIWSLLYKSVCEVLRVMSDNVGLLSKS